MIVTVGILAHNEGAGIGVMLASLFSQSAFATRAQAKGGCQWEVIVVPNGCNDDTAAVARAALDRAVSLLADLPIRYEVCELREGGKSNAWNQYIHAMARPDADVIVMVDSDIEFGHPDTLLNCLSELQQNEHARVVVDLPLKHFVKKERMTLLERISSGASAQALDADHAAIAGSFYCARASTLRQIWMPKGLSSEDGFLKAMIITDNFRSPNEPARVVRARNASHYYEGLTTPRAIFQHELRMVIGTTLNCYLTWDFLKFATDPTGPGAGVLIRNWVQHDPNWYRRLMQNQVRNRGWFVLPRDMWFRRFRTLRGRGMGAAIKRLPLAMIGFCLDLPVFFVANWKLRRGTAIGYW